MLLNDMLVFWFDGCDCNSLWQS